MFLAVSLALHALLLAMMPRPGNGLAVLLPRELLVRLKPAAAMVQPAIAAPPLVPPDPVLAQAAQSMAQQPGKTRRTMDPADAPRAKSAAPNTPLPQAPGAGPGAGQVIASTGHGSGDPVYSGAGAGGGTGAGDGPVAPAANGAGTTAPGGVPGGAGDGALPAPKLPPAAPTPHPAAPKPEPAVDVKAVLAAYASGLKSSIIRHKAYPAVAERLGHEGAVKIGFTVDASGSLDAVTVKSSSGYDELDSAALDAVRAAAPFDPIPVETGKARLNLSITLKFNLNS
jgi:periplasmic protein TonB